MEKIRAIKNNTYDGILFLRGVFKTECRRMEDMFQDRLMTENTVTQEVKIYDKLPVKFTTLTQWPKSTNLACWWCHRTHKNRPWFEPQSIEPTNDGPVGDVFQITKKAFVGSASTGDVFKITTGNMPSNKNIPTKLKNILIVGSANESPSYIKSVSISTHGSFCCENCVVAYIIKHTKDISERHNKISMLKYVYEIFNGKSIPDIQPSPSPTDMVQYGGHLTPVEYQQKIDSLDVAYMRELEDNSFTSICTLYASKIMS